MTTISKRRCGGKYVETRGRVSQRPRTEKSPLLSASDERSLALELQSSQREALLLAVRSPGGQRAVSAIREAIQTGSDAWTWRGRTHDSEGSSHSQEAARNALLDWCKLALKANDCAVEEQLVLGALRLTEMAQTRLLSEAVSSLSSEARRHLNQCIARGKQARARFVEGNQGLVAMETRRFANCGLAAADLYQEGNIGLLRAIDKYNPLLGCRFSTYAVLWIRQSMRRALSNQSRTIRLPVHTSYDNLRLRKVRQQLRAEGVDQPSLQLLSARSDLSLHRLRVLLELPTQPSSLDRNWDTEGVDWNDRLSNPEAINVLDNLVEKGEQARIGGLLKCLGERDRAIVAMRFGLDTDEPETLRAVGMRFDISRERVRQIVANALITLRHRALMPSPT